MTDKVEQQAKKGFLRRWRWPLLAGVIALLLAGAGAVWLVVGTGNAQESRQAPEAGRVLALQAKMPFQIMIPAYLPKEFDRLNALIQVEQAGPAGEPMSEISYSTADGQEIHVREWVPPDSKLETLANSRTIKTKWGTGYLLTHVNMYAIWTDIGPTRTSVFTSGVAKISEEQLLAIAESLGPPSNDQVFTFVVNPPKIKDMPAAPPYSPPINAQGVQEFTLVITPGGYDPLRISLKKDVPVRMTFSQLGQVGCGNTLIFPTDPSSPSSVALKEATDKQVLEFTPTVAGEFPFYCSHQMYRGVVTVRDK